MIIAVLAASTFCVKPELLVDRLMHLAITYQVALIAPTELTADLRAPAMCAHSLREAYELSLRGSGLTFDLIDGHIVVILPIELEWRQVPNGAGGRQWVCVPVDRSYGWPACSDDEKRSRFFGPERNGIPRYRAGAKI